METQQRNIAHLSRVASVGEMASSLAHELNQPLTAILAYATACLNGSHGTPNPASKTVGYLQEISSQAIRAGEIIRRVRGYVRKETPEKQIQDINRIVTEAVNLMHHAMVRGGVAVRLQLASDLAPVLADAVQIQQVLINLLQNAMDAMGSRQIDPRADPSVDPAVDPPVDPRTIVVKTVRLEHGGKGSGVQVSVCDNGNAVDMAVDERLFEPFYTTKTNGLGLGLSICRSIIESHAGRIWAQANSDRGMSFFFTLDPAVKTE
jgi:C4-dicarboxylate-specific signal transduction histidine kinase